MINRRFQGKSSARGALRMNWADCCIKAIIYARLPQTAYWLCANERVEKFELSGDDKPITASGYNSLGNLVEN
ncbi:MAG: hypothetical protein ACTHYC_07930 [Sphingobacterium sp.]